VEIVFGKIRFFVLSVYGKIVVAEENIDMLFILDTILKDEVYNVEPIAIGGS
jgi:hypothetical protein